MKRPFEGLRVADLAWVGVGPTVSKYLADHGAEVIRIESATRPETLRNAPPFVHDEANVDGSGYFANYNSSKLGVSVNLKHAKGTEIVKRLIAECDVVTESFTPGTMARFGLDYESVKAIREDIVMISMPLYGQTGPWADYMGYGHVLQAAAGYNELTGFPDGPPIGTGVAYTDFLAPHFGAVALIAALDYRRRTGKGQYIDLSQLESVIHGLGTVPLDWTANGNEQSRLGNRDVEGAPHGCYKCRDGRYIVVACFTEKQWDGFKAVLGRPDWADLERMRRKWARLGEQKEIDRHVGGWAAGFPAAQALNMMQKWGVPCGIVKSPEDMHADMQLRHRGHYQVLDHPVMGERTYDTAAFRLSKTPGELSKAAPLLGEDNEYVFKQVVGMSDEEFTNLLIDGVFE